MRVGVIVRAEARGLGIQTRAVADALPAERVLYVEPQPASWPQHRDLLTHHKVTHVFWRRGQLHPEREVRRWLKGLDVVYTAESGYDPRLPGWCAADGVTLARHANPEQLAPDEVAAGDPTVWWSATPWRLEHMPVGTRVVPMPVDAPKLEQGASDRVRFVHTVGHHAQEDRAGSRIVAQAVGRLRADCDVTVFCQDRRLDAPFKTVGQGVNLAVRCGGVDDQWSMYQGQDVLVLPRRYGGLSLPSLEALAAGLVLVMTDCEPNQIWPGPRVPVRRRWWSRMRCGQVELHDANPAALAEVMHQLATDRDELEMRKAESRAWAEANTWEALRPLWLAELESASLSRGRQGASTGNAPAAGSLSG